MKEEVKINKETARRLYESVPDFFREQLEEAFGKEAFRKRDFREIKTFEDACESIGIAIDSHTPIYDEEESPDEIAYKKLKIVIAAINQGWIPDWNNTDQKKWWPYFNLSSGFGFSSFGYACTITFVGSRLCFESQEKATYAGQQFLELYKSFLT